MNLYQTKFQINGGEMLTSLFGNVFFNAFGISLWYLVQVALVVSTANRRGSAFSFNTCRLLDLTTAEMSTTLCKDHKYTFLTEYVHLHPKLGYSLLHPT